MQKLYKGFDVYFFKRENKPPIPGSDLISIIAANLDQANLILRETIIDHAAWYFDHVSVMVYESEIN